MLYDILHKLLPICLSQQTVVAHRRVSSHVSVFNALALSMPIAISPQFFIQLRVLRCVAQRIFAVPNAFGLCVGGASSISIRITLHCHELKPLMWCPRFGRRLFRLNPLQQQVAPPNDKQHNNIKGNVHHDECVLR